MATENYINYVVFDVETGGLECDKNPITQIALEVLDGKTLECIQKYKSFIAPYDNLVYDDKALAYTGITMNQINKGKSADVVCAEIKQILLSCNSAKGRFKDKWNPICVGHNVAFDIGFLDYLFFRVGEDVLKYINKNQIDTMSLFHLSTAHKGQSKHNLSATAEHYNIDLTNAHDAEGDVIATSEILRTYTSLLRQDVTNNSSSESVTKQSSRDTFKF